MLYNESTGKPKADVFSLESLIAWLETMPADGTYWYCGSSQCLVAQWLKHVDPSCKVGPGHSFMYVVHGVNTNFERLDDIAIGFPRTFGAALIRARKAAQS